MLVEHGNTDRSIVSDLRILFSMSSPLSSHDCEGNGARQGWVCSLL